MPSPYEKRVEGATRALKSRNVEHRRKAARLLGELGAAEAIPDLIEHAEKDPDPTVRKNAKYALGMFVAFRDAVEAGGDKADTAADAVERLITTGKIGKAAKPAPGTLRRVLLGLVGVLVLIALANVGVFMFTDMGGFALSASGTNETPDRVAEAPDGNSPAAVPVTLEGLVEQANTQLPKMRDNALTLERQYTAAANEDELGTLCLEFYDVGMVPLQIEAIQSEAYPQIAALYDEMNAAQEVLTSAHNRFENACFDEMPLTVAEANEHLTAVQAIQGDFDEWQVDLVQMLVVPTDTPVPTVTGTEAPTFTPTEPPNLDRYASELLTVIDQVTGPRGASTLLTQYWEEAQAGNAISGGCRAESPLIPDDYVLPPGVDESSNELRDAAFQVNAGLQLLRAGWQDFRSACNSGVPALSAGVSSGLQVSQTAQISFDNADQLLGLVLGNRPAPTSLETPEGASQ